MPLFAKRARNPEPTDAGRFVFGLTEDIFKLGSELKESLRKVNNPGKAGGVSRGRPGPFDLAETGPCKRYPGFAAQSSRVTGRRSPP